MAIFRRIANLFSRSKVDLEIQDELRSHIEMRIEDSIANGMSPEAARRDALLKFGNPIVVQEKVTHMDAALGLDTLFRDIRYASRMLWRSKGFTAVAVGSLALGIGANTIIFSLAKGVLLDRLAVPHPEQLRLFTIVMGDRSPVSNFWGDWYPRQGSQLETTSISYPVYEMLRQQNHDHPMLGELFAFKLLNAWNDQTISVDGHSTVVNGQMVSGNFYEQMGIRPQLGRGIEPSDDAVAGVGNIVVISDGLWSRLFGRSASVIGKTIQLNLIPMTIVGVNPPGFTGAASVQIAPDVFFPLSMQPILMPRGPNGHPSLLDSNDMWWVQVMARVRPGVSDATARTAMAAWLEQDVRATIAVKKDAVMPAFELSDGSHGLDDARQDFSLQLYVLLGLTGFVLLLACANLANLLLARSAVRQREMAIRLALGASRGRVIRQMLTESLLLSSLGGIAGLALGYAGRNVIPHMYNAAWQASSLRGDFDATMFVFAAAVSVLTGVLFGVAPAWHAMQTEVNTGLKDASLSTTRRRRGIAGRGLVVLQVALSMLLVVGAGLFAGTLRKLYQEQLGFSAKNILLFTLQVPTARYPAPKDVQLHEQMEERLKRVPGVSEVTLSELPLISHMSSNLPNFRPTDQQPLPGTEANASFNIVGRSFFATYRIPLLYGRSFLSTDTGTSQPVAVINEALAQKFWPHESPLGKTFKMGSGSSEARIYEIVGVAADAKYEDLQGLAPRAFYLLYDQSQQEQQMTYEVKTPLPASEILPGLRAAIAEVDRDLPMRDVRTQQAQIDATVSQQKTFAVLSGAFGVLALVLACIGLYGLMAYDVARRTSEIGIRMALGARAGQMMGMVLREASWMAVVGIIVGLGGVVLLTKYVKAMLYGLTPNDPWILGGAAVLLFAVALLAGWGPARRASRIDPMEALRHE